MCISCNNINSDPNLGYENSEEKEVIDDSELSKDFNVLWSEILKTSTKSAIIFLFYFFRL